MAATLLSICLLFTIACERGTITAPAPTRTVCKYDLLADNNDAPNTGYLFEIYDGDDSKGKTFYVRTGEDVVEFVVTPGTPPSIKTRCTNADVSNYCPWRTTLKGPVCRTVPVLDTSKYQIVTYGNDGKLLVGDKNPLPVITHIPR